MRTNHQGNVLFSSVLTSVGSLFDLGIITGIGLGGFQFLGGTTFLIGGCTIVTFSSTAISNILSEDVIMSNVEHPLRNNRDVSSNALVVASVIEYTNKHQILII